MPILRKALSEFVDARMKELNLNPYDVERQSNNKISHGTVRNIVSGKTREVKDESLETLAKVLRVSTEELYQKARGKTPRNDMEFLRESLDTLYEMTATASGKEREFIEKNIEMLKIYLRQKRGA